MFGITYTHVQYTNLQMTFTSKRQNMADEIYQELIERVHSIFAFERANIDYRRIPIVVFIRQLETCQL